MIEKLKGFFLKRKLLFSLILLLLILIVSFRTWSNYLYYLINGSVDRGNFKLARMINSVIGMPYRQKPEYKNDSADITKLSQEEWWNFNYYKSSLEVDIITDKLNLVDKLPTKQEVEQILSMEIHPMFYRNTLINPIQKKLCNHFLTCEVLTVIAQEYVLEKPELLRNIVKIAERPCNYIRNIEEVNHEGELEYTPSLRLEGLVFYTKKYSKKDINSSIEDTKEKLLCNKQSILDKIPFYRHTSLFKRKYVLIIINKSGIIQRSEKGKTVINPVINILVERKDI